jgi:hypothetical protein
MASGSTRKQQPSRSSQSRATTAFHGDSKLQQKVTAPTGSPQLRLWYQPHCVDYTDKIDMQIRTTTGATLLAITEPKTTFASVPRPNTSKSQCTLPPSTSWQPAPRSDCMKVIVGPAGTEVDEQVHDLSVVALVGDAEAPHQRVPHRRRQRRHRTSDRHIAKRARPTWSCPAQLACRQRRVPPHGVIITVSTAAAVALAGA